MKLFVGFAALAVALVCPPVAAACAQGIGGPQGQPRQHGPEDPRGTVQDRDVMRDRDMAPGQSREGAQDRARLRSEHQAEIKERAAARGVEVAPASEGPIYGGRLTAEERKEYREELRRLDEEREHFIAEHREKMRARAEERGVELEEDE